MEWMLMPYKRLYVLIAGRSSRREFWMFTLLNFLILLGVGMVFLVIGGVSAIDPENLGPAAIGAGFGIMMVLAIPLYIWAMLTGLASFAVAIRRLHDLNLTGWLYLIVVILSFVPLINLLVALGFLGLMCVKGTDGPNKYGEDPTRESVAVFE